MHRQDQRTDEVEEGVPAVAPDGVFARRAATRLLAFAGVDGLEVVDVAVRLVEVSVAVVVVAIPDVEIDVRNSFAAASLPCSATSSLHQAFA